MKHELYSSKSTENQNQNIKKFKLLPNLNLNLTNLKNEKSRNEFNSMKTKFKGNNASFEEFDEKLIKGK